MTVDIGNTTMCTSPFYYKFAYFLMITKGWAIGASRSATVATFAALRIDVSLNTLAKCGVKMPREVAILSPRSGWEAVVKSQGPTDLQSITY